MSKIIRPFFGRINSLFHTISSKYFFGFLLFDNLRYIIVCVLHTNEREHIITSVRGSTYIALLTNYSSANPKIGIWNRRVCFFPIETRHFSGGKKTSRLVSFFFLFFFLQNYLFNYVRAVVNH